MTDELMQRQIRQLTARVERLERIVVAMSGSLHDLNLESARHAGIALDIAVPYRETQGMKYTESAHEGCCE